MDNKIDFQYPLYPDAMYAEFGGWHDFLGSDPLKLLEEKSIARLRQICAKLRLTYSGRWTHHQRKIGLSKNDLIWINNKRKARRLKSNGWFDSLVLEAERLGLDDLFDTAEDASIRRLHYIIKKYETLNNLPSSISTGDKHSDYVWINTKRQAKNSSHKCSNWYPVLDQIASSSGFDGMFDPKSRDELEFCVQRLLEIIGKYKTLDMLPKFSKYNTKQESEDARWINTKVRAKKGDKNKHGRQAWRWFPILDQIASENGFGGMFDPKPKHEQVLVSRLLEIIKRYNTPKNLPSQQSKDAVARSDAKWISTRRQSKRGKGSWRWYPILDKVAASHGFEGMFDSTINRKSNRVA